MAQMLCGNWAISDTAAFGAASEHRRHHSTDVVMNWIILNLSLSTERLILFAILNFVEWHLLRAKNDVFAHCLWMANYFCRTISVRSEKSEFNPRVFFSNSVFLLLFMRTQTKYSANKLLIQNNKTSRDYVTIEHLPFLFHPQIESIWVGSNWFMATLWIIHWSKWLSPEKPKRRRRRRTTRNNYLSVWFCCKKFHRYHIPRGRFTFIMPLNWTQMRTRTPNYGKVKIFKHTLAHTHCLLLKRCLSAAAAHHFYFGTNSCAICAFWTHSRIRKFVNRILVNFREQTTCK